MCGILEIFCFGIEILDFNETERVDRPKRPVRRGKRGDFIGSWKDINPRKPASMNIVSAREILDSARIR